MSRMSKTCIIYFIAPLMLVVAVCFALRGPLKVDEDPVFEDAGSLYRRDWGMFIITNPDTASWEKAGWRFTVEEMPQLGDGWLCDQGIGRVWHYAGGNAYVGCCFYTDCRTMLVPGVYGDYVFETHPIPWWALQQISDREARR